MKDGRRLWGGGDGDGDGDGVAEGDLLADGRSMGPTGERNPTVTASRTHQWNAGSRRPSAAAASQSGHGVEGRAGQRAAGGSSSSGGRRYGSGAAVLIMYHSCCRCSSRSCAS